MDIENRSSKLQDDVKRTDKCLINDTEINICSTSTVVPGVDSSVIDENDDTTKVASNATETTAKPTAASLSSRQQQQQLNTSAPASYTTVKTTRQLVDVMKPAQSVDPNRPHKFWDTQPVPKLTETITNDDVGSIDIPKTPKDVRQTLYNLPSQFEWSDCDLQDETTLLEVYDLLYGHYVEDDDNMFRFGYQTAFLKWALLIPGYKPSWHIGVRVKDNRKLVGFITGTPVTIGIHQQEKLVAEINFLCVHKKLRSKRLAPTLIKEVTRRINLEDIWQGLYTAGVLLPKPIAQCTYNHRALNIKKLIDVSFSFLPERLTISRAVRLYKLPTELPLKGVRQMTKKDIADVAQLLKVNIEKYKLRPIFRSLDEVEHLFLTRDNVIYSYVKETNGQITDFFAFYSLPSSIIGNETHQTLYAAYSFYTIAVTVPLEDLFNCALILARDLGFDVFNALDLGDNGSVFKDLKFGVGDGSLRYYIYNWKMPELKNNEVNMILV